MSAGDQVASPLGNAPDTDSASEPGLVNPDRGDVLAAPELRAKAEAALADARNALERIAQAATASGHATILPGMIVRPLPGSLILDLEIERQKQDDKWGGRPGIDRRDDHTYAAVLGEEFGEVCKAWLERDVEALRVELVQTAAVALAWITELDNGGMRPRPAARLDGSSE